MICENCNSETHHLSVRYTKDGERISQCDRCGDVGNASVPDVFWPGHEHTSMNVTDRMGRPIPMRTRRHKAELFKKMGLAEAGDAAHGTREGAYKYHAKN